MRKLVEFALMVAGVALFARMTYRTEHQHKAKPRGEFNIAGVKLGMTREQVRAKLGRPQVTEPDIEIRGFEVDRYGTGEGYGRPEVTYNTQGLVVRVFGEFPLDWSDGAVDRTTTAAELLELFPTGIVRNSPSMHPWRPGMVLIPDRSLFVLTEKSSFFSRGKYFGAGLAAPYSYEFRHYWTNDSGGGSLLATTGKRAVQLTFQKAQAAQVCACYFCAQRVEIVKPDPTGPGETQVRCPQCGNQTVLAGSSQELTDEFLARVHQEWFEPPSPQAR